MQVYLMSASGYYVKGVSGSGFCFTNKKVMAHSFSEMPIGMLRQLKTQLETALHCELDLDFA